MTSYGWGIMSRLKRLSPHTVQIIAKGQNHATALSGYKWIKTPFSSGWTREYHSLWIQRQSHWNHSCSTKTIRRVIYINVTFPHVQSYILCYWQPFYKNLISIIWSAVIEQGIIDSFDCCIGVVSTRMNSENCMVKKYMNVLQSMER